MMFKCVDNFIGGLNESQLYIWRVVEIKVEIAIQTILANGVKREGMQGGEGRRMKNRIARDVLVVSTIFHILSWTNQDLFVIFCESKQILQNYIMHQYHSLNQGVYLVQSGHKNDTAIIECPYVTQRIEVYDAHGLKILHGAHVYWTQVRRQYLPKRKGNREVISAVVVGIKHCEYLCEGKNFLCTLKIEKEGLNYKIQGLPVNKKLPSFDVINSTEIERQDFSKMQVIKKYEKRYFWARFLYWNYEENSPKGCILSTFRKEYKTPEVQGQVLMHCLQISQKQSTLLYPKHLSRNHDYLPIKNHRQFYEMMFTIDPANSIDMEDGLSIEELGDGIYQLGVHISDVTSYKHLINRREIANKGASTYLPHKTIHMMPPKLVEQLAFKAKKRRLAFSAFFSIDINGKIYSSRFQKTVVKSTAQLSYEQAQDIIDSKINESKLQKQKDITAQTYGKLKQRLLILKTIAFNRRQQRNNTEIFDKNQVVFQLDQHNTPIDIGLKKRIDSEKMIEQFMILTNCQVAKKLVNDFGAHSLLIYHPKPLDINLTYLNDYISQLGVKFKADNLDHLENEFKQLFEKEAIDDGLKQLLLLKAIQIQEFAVYTRCLNTYKGHFGLSLQYYTHFTSPVRRFADLMVHEQLQKCISNQQLKNHEIAQLEQEIELINKARARGKRLKQFAVECFINLYLYTRREKIRSKGFIIRLGLRSATIFLPLYNLTKQVSWKGSASYLQKDKVELIIKNEEDTIIKEFQKNDSIDVEMTWQIHQQVQLNLIIEHNHHQIRI